MRGIAGSIPALAPKRKLYKKRDNIMQNNEIPTATLDLIAELEAVKAERDALANKLEIERMRLAACGVVAMSDTPDSLEKALDMHDDYKSASCEDVARRVRECIQLRSRIESAE
jgi:hypothetical protein